MIRTDALPRSVRAGGAVVAVAGVVTLAGCGASGTATGAAGGGATYADGTYTAQGAYQTPESVETITVTVTLQDDVITDVHVSGNPRARESQEYQGRFIGGIADAVVGQDIDSISVSRVAGSSLTSGGFNRAIEEIKAEAAG